MRDTGKRSALMMDSFLGALVALAWKPVSWDAPLTYSHGHPSGVAMWSDHAGRWVYW